MYFIGEGDGLVCRRGFFLAGKGAKEIPELFRISAVVRFGEGVLPLLLGVLGGEGGYFFIKERNSRMGRVVFAKEVTFLDKGFGCWGEGGVVIFDEASRYTV